MPTIAGTVAEPVSSMQRPEDATKAEAGPKCLRATSTANALKVAEQSAASRLRDSWLLVSHFHTVFKLRCRVIFLEREIPSLPTEMNDKV